MAKGFIASAINLNADIQEHLTCVIHRGLLSHPMILPCKGKHRLCQECTKELIQSSDHINCPECRELHHVPSDWADLWFDRVLHNITSKLSNSEAEINQKMIKFVQESYSRYGSSNQRLHIKSVQIVSNPRLKDKFDKCKQALNSYEIITLLHGTTRKAALSISGQGFCIPTSFDRGTDNGKEGELKFGKAIYFAEAKKATEYGKNTLVLADCILGRIQEKDVSELKLTPSIVHQRGYHTIHYNNHAEGIVNQEWAIYKSEQCYPLCIIDYEFLDGNSSSEDILLNRIKTMSPVLPDLNIIRQALIGTENQCKEALKFLGDAAKNNLPSANRVTPPWSTTFDSSSTNRMTSPWSTTFDSSSTNRVTPPWSTSFDSPSTNRMTSPWSTTFDSSSTNRVTPPWSTTFDSPSPNRMTSPWSITFDLSSTNRVTSPWSTTFDSPSTYRETSSLLASLPKEQVGSLLKHPNETIRILFLRAFWRIGQRDHDPQLYTNLITHWVSLIEALQSGYTDVSWRACGVIANMAAVIIVVRKLLVSHQVLNQLMLLLKRAVEFHDKICVLTVLHLMANIAASEHETMKQQKNILDYVNEHLLDHRDIEIQEAGNRLFCNIIGKGALSADWQRGGYKVTAMAPTIE